MLRQMVLLLTSRFSSKYLWELLFSLLKAYLCLLTSILFVCPDQELLAAGGYNVPRTIHEVIAIIACRLARWDDRCGTLCT